MVRTKKVASESIISNVQSVALTSEETINIENYLTQIRDKCRARGLQIWNKQSLSDLIYQDLLFIYHIPRLLREEILTLNIDMIGKGNLTEISFKGLSELKDEEERHNVFKLLWTELQRSEIKRLFIGREFAMFAIHKNEKSQKKYFALMKDLIDYSAKVVLKSYDSNAGFTYFKKDLNRGTAKVFGQFYTPPSVLSSVVNVLKPKSSDIVLDPSCGSCSFLQETGKYIKTNENVDSKTAFKNLRGVEIEPNIYTEGIMNMFINFGILPDMDHHIRQDDAFLTLLDSDEQVDKIVANPPFGAEATSFFEHYFTTTLVANGKKQLKTQVVNPAIKLTIPHTKTKESAILFFQIIVQKLKNGGMAGVVMNGSIFNDAHSEMIHWFLDTCNLTKIIINPPGTFKDQGTNIETYSFIFTKGTPTKTIQIVMLGAENDTVRSLSYDNVKDAGWRIKVREEEVKIVYTGVYEQKKLADVVDIFTTGKNCSETEPGDVPFYMSNGIAQYVNISQFDGEYLLTARCGSLNGCQFYVNGKFCASDFTYVIKTKECLLTRYLYYMFKFVDWIPMSSGTTMRGLKREVLLNRDIILPSIPIQELIVTNLNRIFINPDDMADTMTFSTRAMDLMLKDPTGATLEDVVNGLRMKRAYLASADLLKSQMASVMRSVSMRGYDQKAIQDVCDYKNGATLDKAEKNDDGQYNVMGGGMDYVGKYNKFNREGYTITISKSGASAGFVKEHSDKFWAGDCFSIYPKSDLLEYKYLYNILKLNPTITTSKITGSTIPHCKWSDICDSLICVPPLSIQQEVLTILNTMEAERTSLEQMAEKAVIRTQYILDGYLT